MFRTGFNYDRNAASNESGIACSEEEGRTLQQFKEECDINTIVRRFGLTGELPDNFRPPMIGDFTEVMDFQSALNAVRRAEEAFMEMPADLRARFSNDPQKLIEFLGDDKNRDEADKLGLLQKPPEKTRDAVMAIDELAAALKPPEGAPKV